MSSKKKPVNKDDIKVSLRYGVTIPEKELLDLLQLDCAGEIIKLSKEFPRWSPGQIFAKLKELGKVFSVTSSVLNLIQQAWGQALSDYAEDTKLPQNFCPSGCKLSKPTKGGNGLSETEKRKIRALRKQGLSIKAIGKEIHRAEKVVADFVKTLPKK